MDISKFKEGDVITRNEPCGTDGSYTGDRVIFRGFDPVAKIIFFEHQTLGVVDISYARDAWNEGWCEYPESMFQKALNYLNLYNQQSK